MSWLEIHCANCAGFDGVDKKSFEDRRRWVDENKKDILKIAKNPLETFDLWKNADKPFAYVAACLELKDAWNDPKFVSRLPIPFDGSCNGIQHLSLLSRDRDAAARVNLVKSKTPRDVYSEVASLAKSLIVSDSGALAEFWQGCFEGLDRKAIRKLCKSPVMTLGYGVTDAGTTLQLVDAYRNELRRNSEPPVGGWRYLAEKIREAANELLPGPMAVMDYIREIAQHCTNGGRLMEWTTPSGFPCCNRYVESKVKQVALKRRGKSGSLVRVARHNVPDGWTGKILDKAPRKAAPNFVHSLDAAHLVSTVILAGQWGIKDVVVVHDSFGCHASHADIFREAIKSALFLLYSPEYSYYLMGLREKNVSSADFKSPPPMGDYDLRNIGDANYGWM